MSSADLANRTREDAYLRVLDARMGSLVNATPEYCAALAGYLEEWAQQAREELAKLQRLAARAEELRREDAEEAEEEERLARLDLADGINRAL